MEKYINVTDLSDKIKKLSNDGWYLEGLVGTDELYELVRTLPAADVVEVRHGRWISDSPGKRFGTVVRLDKDGCPVGSCHCSECGEWLTASDEYPVIGYYCPNCGARMDGGMNDGKAD